VNLPYLPVVVLSVCAIGFYRAGRHEQSWGILWAALSIAFSVAALRFSTWGMMGVLLAQVLLFGCITLYRMWRND
jgi:hypothetical protein